MFGIAKVKEYCDAFVDFYYDAYWASSTLEDADQLETTENFSREQVGLGNQHIDIILGVLPSWIMPIVIANVGLKAYC